MEQESISFSHCTDQRRPTSLVLTTGNIKASKAPFNMWTCSLETNGEKNNIIVRRRRRDAAAHHSWKWWAFGRSHPPVLAAAVCHTQPGSVHFQSITSPRAQAITTFHSMLLTCELHDTKLMSPLWDISSIEVISVIVSTHSSASLSLAIRPGRLL